MVRARERLGVFLFAAAILAFWVGLAFIAGWIVGKMLPTTYAELWGDWEGHWEWRGTGAPSNTERHTLELQSIVGLLPTILAVVGWLGLLADAVRSHRRLAIALVPGLGLLGYLYFTVAYPTSDGDVLKASYM